MPCKRKGHEMVQSVGANYSILDYYKDVQAKLNQRMESWENGEVPPSDDELETSTSSLAETTDTEMLDVPLPNDMIAFAEAMDNFASQTPYSYEATSFLITAQSYIDTETIVQTAVYREANQKVGYTEFQELVNMDPDQDFQIDYDEFKRIMNYLAGGETTASEEQDQEMFAGLDKNSDGNISLVDYFA